MKLNKINTGIYNRKTIEALWILKEKIWQFEHWSIDMPYFNIAETGELVITINSPNLTLHKLGAKIMNYVKMEHYNERPDMHLSHQCYQSIYRTEDMLFNVDRMITVRVPVSHIAVACGILKNNNINGIIKLFGKDVVDEAIGCPLDPFEAELMKFKKEQVEALLTEYNNEIKKANDEYKLLLNALESNQIRVKEEQDEKLRNELIALKSEFGNARLTLV